MAVRTTVALQSFPAEEGSRFPDKKLAARALSWRTLLTAASCTLTHAKSSPRSAAIPYLRQFCETRRSSVVAASRRSLSPSAAPSVLLRSLSSHPPPVVSAPEASAAAAKPNEPELMLSPPVVFDNLRCSIIAGSSRPPLRIFASAVLAGGLLASSCAVVIAVVGGLPVAIGIQKLVAGMLFPAGLSIILFLQADLLTSQMSHLALPRVVAAGDPALVSCADKALPPAHAARLLSIVFAGNFVGSVAVAAAAAPLLFAALPFSAYAAAAAVTKTSLPWAVAFTKGIGANYLVNVAVYMAACAKTPGGKMAALWMPIMSFVALGLEHSVANMFIIPVGIFCGADVTFAGIFWNNLIPMALGNLVGGLIFASHALLHPLPGVNPLGTTSQR